MQPLFLEGAYPVVLKLGKVFAVRHGRWSLLLACVYVSVVAYCGMHRCRRNDAERDTGNGIAATTVAVNALGAAA